jgi:hypothetical protein
MATEKGGYVVALVVDPDFAVASAGNHDHRGAGCGAGRRQIEGDGWLLDVGQDVVAPGTMRSVAGAVLPRDSGASCSHRLTTACPLPCATALAAARAIAKAAIALHVLLIIISILDLIRALECSPYPFIWVV